MRAGFPLNDQLFKMIIRRYSDEHGDMDFDNFIGCLVRLDAMCREYLSPLAPSVWRWRRVFFPVPVAALAWPLTRVCVRAGAFKTLDKGNSGCIELDIKEVRQC